MAFGFAKSGKRRLVCRRRSGGEQGVYCYSTTDLTAKGVRDQKGNAKVQRKTPIFKRSLGGTSRFIVTAAQNATPVHKDFMRSLGTACNKLNAELLVIPLRYKNPTSRWTDSQANEEVWADEIAPYLYNARKALCKNLIVLGDCKTQPTASQPLSGFEAMTHGESGILGHTKLALRSIPTPQSRFPKLMTTTGAVTVKNYTDSKAGKLGEFHHTLGAALVEVQGSKFHLRQLNAGKDGGFFDLDTFYGPDMATSGHAIEALTMGDTHVDFICPQVKRATFDRGGIIDTLKPKHLVWHDLLDGHAVNPHHYGNPFHAIAKNRGDRRNAEAELRRACAFVDAHTPEQVLSVIVSSNHDDFLGRWIVATDWRTDAENAQFYLETALEMVRRTKLSPGGTEYPNAFQMWAQRLLQGDRFKILNNDESYLIAGIENGMHGHRGPNGARGSIKNLRRIGVRSNIGHAHAPGIDEGCYQGGTSTLLQLEYTGGPSSWLNTHILTYKNSKRSLINIIDGEYRIR